MNSHSTWRLPLPIVVAAAFILGVSRVFAANRAIPTLHEMAGDWCPVENVLNPPAMDNRRDMLQVCYDLVSTRYDPGDTMMSQTAKAGVSIEASPR